jgi:hypothetical protein
VARYVGDDTVLGLLVGGEYRELEIVNGNSLMQTTGAIIRAIAEHHPSRVVVDDDGVGGGVVDRLREQGHDVIAFRGGEAAVDKENYFNRRTEAHYTLANALRDGDIAIRAIGDGGELVAQLTAVTGRTNSKGQLQLESKDDMKKRGVESPDRGDTMAMAIHARLAPSCGLTW